uniref:AAA+ ATPase domain-containing protein n=1 Tax=Leersia perrieri TaxID=77586 RepID=A0A0D9VNM0_9ORYZ
MSGGAVVVAVAYAAVAMVALRLALSYKSAIYAARRLWRWADEWAQAYQYHEVPRHSPDGSGGENPLFRKAASYVSSLPSLEDADAASVLLLSPSPSSSPARTNGGISLHLGPGHTARDSFLGARLSWTCRGEALVLRVRRHDRTRVLRPYLQHVESVADEIELRRRELRLFANAGVDGRWTSAPFTHPATLDTVAMDPDLKSRVQSDLESFLKGRAYYHRLGRVWRRSYLLYGPSGTGKSTFAAAMARFLGYDVYDIDLSRAGDLRDLLLRTTPRSLILVEDLDRFLLAGGGEATARVVNFMDGVASCCGEERVMVFTMRGGKEGIEAAVMRPGRLDVHIQFTMCDFEAFKAMASSYLGLKDHKLYPQVEEGFHAAGDKRISPAELGEIMLANRSSPSRALRNVITKLHRVSSAGAATAEAAARPPPHRRNTSWSGEEKAADGGEEAAACGVFVKDAPMREIKKLYGLIKIRSRKEGSGGGGGGMVPLHAGEDDTER